MFWKVLELVGKARKRLFVEHLGSLSNFVELSLQPHRALTQDLHSDVRLESVDFTLTGSSLCLNIVLYCAIVN